MIFIEFCMLFLAFAILALVHILASILQEHRSEAVTRTAAQPLPARNPTPRRRQAINNEELGRYVLFNLSELDGSHCRSYIP